MNKILIAAILGISLICQVSAQTAADSAFLEPKDHILFVGDSITANRTYQSGVIEALNLVYPQGDLKISTVAAGGADAGSLLKATNEYLSKNSVSIICLMFGVNDTRWSPDNGEVKVPKFIDAMGEYKKMADTAGAQLIVLRETHFSHGKNGVEGLAKLNAMLDRLQNAQTEWAETNLVPIIDVRGAYESALNKAWQVDPDYEFSPDVVHPSSPGNAAITIEILRAFGVGLPLAVKGSRGPLNRSHGPIKIQVEAQYGITGGSSLNLNASLENQTGKTCSGEVVLVCGPQIFRQSLSVNAGGKKAIQFPLNLEKMSVTSPIYLAFSDGSIFSSAGSFIYLSPVLNLTDNPFVAESFLPKEDSTNCPVNALRVSWEKDALIVDFQWKKEPMVMAGGAFKSRMGPLVDGPLDLSSPVGQPCDAVEIFLDLRPEISTGRYTAEADANPAGIHRLGLYWSDEKGPTRVEMVGFPEVPSGATVRSKENDSVEVRLPMKSGENHFGFSMAVTAAKEFKPGGGKLFRLTANRSLNFEPMSYVRMSPSKSGTFYRIGY